MTTPLFRMLFYPSSLRESISNLFCRFVQHLRQLFKSMLSSRKTFDETVSMFCDTYLRQESQLQKPLAPLFNMLCCAPIN